MFSHPPAFNYGQLQNLSVKWGQFSPVAAAQGCWQSRRGRSGSEALQPETAGHRAGCYQRASWRLASALRGKARSHRFPRSAMGRGPSQRLPPLHPPLGTQSSPSAWEVGVLPELLVQPLCEEGRYKVPSHRFGVCHQPPRPWFACVAYPSHSKSVVRTLTRAVRHPSTEKPPPPGPGPVCSCLPPPPYLDMIPKLHPCPWQ